MVSPVFVMYVFLVCLTPMLVDVVQRTHNGLEALRLAEHRVVTNDDVEMGTGQGSDNGSRPGVERTLSKPTVLINTGDAESMLFKRGEANEDEQTSLEQTAETAKGVAEGTAEGIDDEGSDGSAGGLTDGSTDTRVATEIPPDAGDSLAASDAMLHLCYVCEQRPRDSVLSPCLHGGLCYGCAKRLVTTTSLFASARDPPKCPLCRESVEEVLRLSGRGTRAGELLVGQAWTVGS